MWLVINQPCHVIPLRKTLDALFLVLAHAPLQKICHSGVEHARSARQNVNVVNGHSADSCTKLPAVSPLWVGRYGLPRSLHSVADTPKSLACQNKSAIPVGMTAKPTAPFPAAASALTTPSSPSVIAPAVSEAEGTEGQHPLRASPSLSSRPEASAVCWPQWRDRGRMSTPTKLEVRAHGAYAG